MELLGFGIGRISHTVWRFFQFVLAITVCGLYGTDLNKANREHKYSDGKWVYAVVTGSLSAVTAVLHLIPLFNLIPMLFLWDTILFILWIAVFGTFGKLYISEDPEGNAGVQRMVNSVWVDLVNALLWLGSAVGMVWFWSREKRTRWTGRAMGRSGSPGV